MFETIILITFVIFVYVGFTLSNFHDLKRYYPRYIESRDGFVCTLYAIVIFLQFFFSFITGQAIAIFVF